MAPPHVTNDILLFFFNNKKKFRFVLCERGGAQRAYTGFVRLVLSMWCVETRRSVFSCAPLSALRCAWPFHQLAAGRVA